MFTDIFLLCWLDSDGPLSYIISISVINTIITSTMKETWKIIILQKFMTKKTSDIVKNTHSC